MKCPEDRSNEFSRNRKPYSKARVCGFLWLAAFAFGAVSLAAAQEPAQDGAAQAPVQAPAAQAPAAQTPADTPKPATPQTPQQKQLADDTAKLLSLANELKAELDKSNKDTLSLSVIKKAEQVEKLAHKVRDEMKASQPN
jgi:sRNA-binding protein